MANLDHGGPDGMLWAGYWWKPWS